LFIYRQLQRSCASGANVALHGADARFTPSHREKPMNMKRLVIVAATLALAGVAGTASASPPTGVRCAGSAFAQLFGADVAAQGTCTR
jgi:hypothetical protein